MKRWILLDGVFLLALMIYVIAGYRKVPLHGDEPTHIYMSRDYYYLVQQRDLDAVLYTDAPQNPAEQELRILNGTVHKMLMGLAWDLAGLTVDDVNEQWVWEWTWDQNVALGHVPSDDLLDAARLSSALLVALSVILVSGITKWVTGSRLAAWAAGLIYATNPAVLLNGRRAMMEGALLFFTALVVLIAVIIARQQGRASMWWYVALGLAGGGALASKHNTVVIVAAVFAAMMVIDLWSLRRGNTILKLVVAGVLVIVTFLALNPAWWSDLPGMPDRVLTARSRIVDGQIEQARQNGDTYNHVGDRVAGLINEAFFAGPQYYEAPVWRDYIGDQIDSYESSGLAGRGGGPGWGALLVVLVIIGGGALAGLFPIPLEERRADQVPSPMNLGRGFRGENNYTPGPALVILIVFGVTAVSLLIATPFEWQRYYVLLHLPIAVIAGSGLGWIGRTIRGWNHVA